MGYSPQFTEWVVDMVVVGDRGPTLGMGLYRVQNHRPDIALPRGQIVHMI